MSALITVLIAVGILLVVWFVVERFSPDPLITKIAQIAIFIIALVLIISKLLPLVGVSF